MKNAFDNTDIPLNLSLNRITNVDELNKKNIKDLIKSKNVKERKWTIN